MLKFFILSTGALLCAVYEADRNNLRAARTARNQNHAPIPSYSSSIRSRRTANSTSSNTPIRNVEEKIEAFYNNLYNKIPVKRELYGFNYVVGLDDLNNSFNILNNCLTNPSRLLRTPIGQTEYEADKLKKWVHKFSSEVFNPDFKLFEYTDKDVKVIKLNRSSANKHDHMKKLELVGLFTGFAIYHQHLLNVEFSIPFLKSVLNIAMEILDLKDAEPEYYKTLSTCCKPNRALLYNKFIRPVKSELSAFRQGLETVIPLDLLKQLNGDEIKLVLEGKENYNLEFWQKITSFDPSCTSQLIEWYWQTVAFFDNEAKSKMLCFITGSKRLPVYRLNIFTMNIFCFGTPQEFPTANPSIRRMNLPKYRNFNDVTEKIVHAIRKEIK